MMLGHMREYLKLGRTHAAGAPGVLPIIGALCGGAVSLTILGQLFLIAALHYTWGVVMNELLDRHIDARSPILSGKPLVSGTIGVNSAKALSISALLLAFFLAWFWFTPLAFIFLVQATLAGVCYNLTTKKLLGADVFMGLWAGFLVFFGAAAVWNTIPVLAWPFFGIWIVRLLHSNSVSGGLKDLENDRSNGCITVPIGLGVRVSGSQARYTPAFRTYEFGIEAVFLLLLATPLIFGWVMFEPIDFLLMALLLILFIGSGVRISSTDYDREKVKRSAVLHEVASFALMALILSDVVGVGLASLVILIPLLVLMVMLPLAYGREMPAV